MFSYIFHYVKIFIQVFRNFLKKLGAPAPLGKKIGPRINIWPPPARPLANVLSGDQFFSRGPVFLRNWYKSLIEICKNMRKYKKNVGGDKKIVPWGNFIHMLSLFGNSFARVLQKTIVLIKCFV